VNLRLQPFGFEMTREGQRERFVFYAISEPAALVMARDWAKTRDWTLEEPSA
jgi:hypothetical protein